MKNRRLDWPLVEGGEQPSLAQQDFWLTCVTCGKRLTLDELQALNERDAQWMSGPGAPKPVVLCVACLLKTRLPKEPKAILEYW